MEAGPTNWEKTCFVPTKSDAQVVAFRKWLKKYSGGQINWGGKFNRALPPSPPKEQLMDSLLTQFSQVLVTRSELQQLQPCIQVSQCTRGSAAGDFHRFNRHCCCNQAEHNVSGRKNFSCIDGNPVLRSFEMVGSLHLQEFSFP
ncbi:unnamed protein product [Dovyalis caffra]|uniref:Uncharacterized protein n=1 Tax=Dovyalis caffra TaxID=77055 RepID=A0AAV1RS30_9ROSI|nr:unnamed protein product [Dovyalis caffra]